MEGWDKYQRKLLSLLKSNINIKGKIGGNYFSLNLFIQRNERLRMRDISYWLKR